MTWSDLGIFVLLVIVVTLAIILLLCTLNMMDVDIEDLLNKICEIIYFIVVSIFNLISEHFYEFFGLACVSLVVYIFILLSRGV